MERKKILRSDSYLVEERREDKQQWRKEEETKRENRQEWFMCQKKKTDKNGLYALSGYSRYFL
jgi:hypothetical protein